MSEYTPDKFVIIKITGDNETFYRVFGSWGGGYLHGDSWRLNSGIERHEIDGDYINFIGSSGSVYRCYIQSEGVTGYTGSVLQQMLERTNIEDGWEAETITLGEYLNDIEQSSSNQ